MQRLDRGTALAAVLTGVLCAAGAGTAHAADTVETWDVGATDVDFYLGFDGISADEGSSFGDIMLGYGILDGFSAYLGTTLEGNEHLAEGSSTLYFGIFGTALNTDHFDLDVFLRVASGGDELQLAPALELNWDLDPEMRTWGTYLRARVPLYGHEVPSPGPSLTMEQDATYHVETCVGAYRTLGESHQVLVEYNVDFHPASHEDVRSVDHGGVALGYNVMLTDSVELINQVYVDVPQGDEAVAYGVMTGFIATLPSARGQ
jgi:hypothetical protein